MKDDVSLLVHAGERTFTLGDWIGAVCWRVLWLPFNGWGMVTGSGWLWDFCEVSGFTVCC